MSTAIDDHFKDRGPAVLVTYTAVLTAARNFGPVREEVKKTSTHLVQKTAFAGDAAAGALQLPAMNSHRLAEERSLALHRAIVEILARDPSQIERARARVRGWQEDRSVHAHYADEWARLLAGPFDALCRMLMDDSEKAKALRHVTPFAGVVDPRARWKIWSDVRGRMSDRA